MTWNHDDPVDDVLARVNARMAVDPEVRAAREQSAAEAAQRFAERQAGAATALHSILDVNLREAEWLRTLGEAAVARIAQTAPEESDERGLAVLELWRRAQNRGDTAAAQRLYHEYLE